MVARLEVPVEERNDGAYRSAAARVVDKRWNVLTIRDCEEKLGGVRFGEDLIAEAGREVPPGPR